MVGSTLFLSVRLLWMAVIIYATADKVLVPILGLDPSFTPYLCMAMGLITVIYTSMGGLRAVVVTDVVQFLILFCAIIATLAIITADLGSVGAWWPSRWPDHWPEPQFGYSPGVRVTAVGAILAHFTWWVCTASSDQMAIQRYLATRNAQAARKALIISLVADVMIGTLLASLGLALMAYFQANPSLIPEGQTILTNPESLFPRFIVSRLPTGFGGLVIAGLLSAAMSSLSSGLNASCSVVVVDFIDQFRRGERKEIDRVKLAKVTSVVIGTVVVALSCFVGMLKGNLVETCYVVINLPVVPLFGLFFMALFVRWATPLGAILGTVCSLVVVVAISYWDELTGTAGISFLWAMPFGVLTSVTVGMLASLLPFGHKGTQDY